MLKVGLNCSNNFVHPLLLVMSKAQLWPYHPGANDARRLREKSKKLSKRQDDDDDDEEEDDEEEADNDETPSNSKAETSVQIIMAHDLHKQVQHEELP